MDIVEVLTMRGFDTTAPTKLVRHRDGRFDLRAMHRGGCLEVYQAYQGHPVFHRCQYIVSFLGSGSRRATLVGVYRVLGNRPAAAAPLPQGFEYPESVKDARLYYDLQALPGWDDLKDRLVIDWGSSPLAWHQWLRRKGVLNSKVVVEILPKGYVAEFPGYLEVDIAFEELKQIMGNEAANREWHRSLSAVAGVYMILDTASGKQYVGSAYGEEGILGRWKAYATNPHGGNLRLMEWLLKHGEARAKEFRFSILHTLPRTLTKEQVIVWEERFKHKLGSREFGLNGDGIEAL